MDRTHFIGYPQCYAVLTICCIFEKMLHHSPVVQEIIKDENRGITKKIQDKYY